VRTASAYWRSSLVLASAFESLVVVLISSAHVSASVREWTCVSE
jgi:hypothetical protein